MPRLLSFEMDVHAGSAVLPAVSAADAVADPRASLESMVGGAEI
jgi:hypothetical protein